MGGAASKNKGKTGERELCKMLEGIFGGSFIRVPNSGAYVGGDNAKRKEILSEGQIRLVKGDIITPDHMPKFVLESKFYKEFPFHLLLSNEPVLLLDGWITQCLDCVDPDDFWMVCFKINRRGWFGCIDQKHQDRLSFKNHCVYNGHLVFPLKPFFNDNKEEILKLSL